ncbi:CRAL-TRIO domain-containing protein [Dichotomocladium elegans]|nr:CRAL-TRIO domain-containing protein [Dichotomocladium elegans]
MTQNKFVKQFTPEETEAVAKLKAILPDVLKAAFKSEGEPEPYALYGIALDKDSDDERLDVLLVKYLRARDLDLEAASKMLSNNIAWRREFKADTILEEHFDDSVFGEVGYILKTDKDKRPVCYNFYGNLDQEKVFGDKERFIRWRVQLMEKGVQLIDFTEVDSMVQVHDYKGASMFGRTTNAKAATKEIIKLMQDNYPEFLSTKFFVNVPWWGSKIFNFVRPWLPEATVKKFVVCSNQELVETLSEKIPIENLPAVYTGNTARDLTMENSEDPKPTEADEPDTTAATHEDEAPKISAEEGEIKPVEDAGTGVVATSAGDADISKIKAEGSERAATAT